MFKDYRFPGDRPFRSKRLIYPYTLQDEFSTVRQDVAYQTVVLENEYIRVIIIPDLRGRIQGAIDKRNGWDFLYHNHVIKPADIAIRQAWIAGGLEWNHPQGHGYTQFEKISYKIVEGADGSKTVVVAEIEPNRMMKWEVAITLRPGCLYIETLERFVSLVNYPIPFVSFQNAAVHATDSTETVFPQGTWITRHGKPRFIKWPYLGDIDLSYYKNLKGSLSVFADGAAVNQDFFGVYSHEKQAGTVIVADHTNAPGKKYFSWGAHPDGRVWDRLLSDSDGPYLELQLGAFWDNLGYGYSWLYPLEEKRMTAYWYPIKDISGFAVATKDLALNAKYNSNNRIFIGAQATRNFSNSKLRIYSGDQLVFERPIDLEVSKPLEYDVKLQQRTDPNNLRILIVDANNNELVQYVTTTVESTTPQSPAKNKSKDRMSIDELYNQGKSFYQDPFSPAAKDYYSTVLERDSLESRANLELAILYYHQGKYDKSKDHLHTVLLRDHLNASAYKAHLYLGMIAFEQGDYHKARPELELASRFAETTEQALYYLGKTELALGDHWGSISCLTQALNTAGNRARIWAAMAIAYRKTGMKREALHAISTALREDPLEFTAITEQWLWGNIDNAQFNELFDRRSSTFVGSQLYIEQACKYIELAYWRDAAVILEQAIRHFESTGKVYPMLEYYLGYVYAQIGDIDRAREYYNRASVRKSDYVFPYRKTSINVLRSALSLDSEHANTWLYLGNVSTYLRRHRQGLAAWEKAYLLDSKNPVLLRNLAHAVWYVLADTAKTIEYLERGCQVDPADTQLFLDLDRMYQSIGAEGMRVQRFEGNIAFVRTSDVLVQRWVTLLLRLGQRELDEHDFAAASNRFGQAKDLMLHTYFFPREGSKKVHERYAEACFGLAEAFLELRRPREALTQIQDGLDYPENLNVGPPAYPVNARAFFLMALAYEALDDSKNAGRYFRESARTRVLPATEGGFYKALALRKIGKSNEANELLEQCRNMLEARQRSTGEFPAVSLFVLAEVYSALGDKAKSQEYRNFALQNDPDVILNARIESSTIPWEGRSLEVLAHDTLGG